MLPRKLGTDAGAASAQDRSVKTDCYPRSISTRCGNGSIHRPPTSSDLHPVIDPFHPSSSRTLCSPGHCGGTFRRTSGSVRAIGCVRGRQKCSTIRESVPTHPAPANITSCITYEHAYITAIDGERAPAQMTKHEYTDARNKVARATGGRHRAPGSTGTSTAVASSPDNNIIHGWRAAAAEGWKGGPRDRRPPQHEE